MNPAVLISAVLILIVSFLLSLKSLSDLRNEKRKPKEMMEKLASGKVLYKRKDKLKDF